MGNPKIRFKWYTDAWEQRKLGELCEVTMGQSPDGSTYSDEPSDYILVQGNADLKDGWVFPRIWTTQKTKTAQAGDLIMSVRAPAGAMGKTAYDVVLGRGVAGIKGNEFVYQTLVKFDSDGYWKKLAAGSTFESVNSDAVKGAILLVPQDVEEQEKIGQYFSHLDHLITLHQRKCNEIKTLKKYMLQKMFPQNGTNIPEIRFNGFTDAWKQCKFGELGSVCMCKRIFKEQTLAEGDIPFYKIGTFGGEPDAFITRELYKEYKEKFQYPEIGDILISASGTIGRIVEYTGEDAYFQDSNIVWFKHDERVDNLFLKCVYSIVKWLGIEGSTIKRLYNDNFLKTEFYIPAVEEQTKIGRYFSNLDHLITLHQRKYNELQSIKKFMLQNMFV
ncbi:MAG: restriction endonuclease subunit S [Lachnospiraceae bacterium]|nr:restriction endonuclease subunit S [Lachnospiraceae bacterium]